MKNETIDRDLAFSKIMTNIKKIEGKPYVKVGVMEGPLVVIAASNEFGTNRAGRGNSVTIPERSYMRSTFDEKKDEWTKLTDRLRMAVLTGKQTIDGALKILGLEIQADVKKKIVSGVPPANALSTLEKKTVGGKRGTTTLVDTGDLLGAIDFQVVK
jgi:hypothetical protein